MNALAIIGLLGLTTTAVLAIYWTVWKVRAELNKSLDKMISELSEIRKALAANANKT